MKTRLLLLGAVSALAAAAPAAAQYPSRDVRPGLYGVDASFEARIRTLQGRLDAGISAGTIDRREAWTLRREIDDLSRLERRYSFNGFSAYERADLQRRLAVARRDLRVADNGGYDRDERYGYDDKGDYGMGGPEDDWIGLRVGERATSNLYGVPSEYLGLYRDRYGTYFRSDGRNIYEIDARTNTVVGIHPMNR
jgi:hypothetical protein